MVPKPSKLQPAIIGGAIIGFISAVPFLNLINCFCCAGILLGGFLAVMLYKNNITAGMAPLSLNDAIIVGALAGLFGAVIGTFLEAIFLGFFGPVVGEAILEFIEQTEIELPAEVYDELEEALRNTTFGLGWLIMNLFFGAIIDALFGLLGGLLGYAVFKPKVPPAPTTLPPPTALGV